MREGQAQEIRRVDYRPPAYWIRSVELAFDLDPARTLVTSRMRIERNAGVAPEPLRLNGEDIDLLRVNANGQSVSFRNEGGLLTIENLPEGEFTLEIRNSCAPERNTQLSGLYTSGKGFFTQCEAEGFRRITFFLDRPDVMAAYTVILRADKAAYPVLLSNGNLLEEGPLDGGRHYAKWHDPHPKPSYLFALVAADLAAREQRIRSRSGGEHLLQVWVRRGELERAEHAMNSLVASVAWDEARFKLPLDLERFMIVAVDDFNMGAMENKGLNLFNAQYVLASPATSVDADYAAIESIVGHEYFHNWTGNRVTCRDWFQLSLKEGLTVFRDQEFSMDMAGSESAAAVRRIEAVRELRQDQFPEDAGPMAHPVRPESYVQINNFYTSTVYEKGAEVVRMMQTLTSREGFARGMALYFERHDGQAVTCDDFVQAIADANPGSALETHLEGFRRWYAQAGTPRVVARGRYDAPTRSYTLGLEQQGGAAPFVIPVAMGLVARDGRALPLRLEDEPVPAEPRLQRVLVLHETKNFFTFVDVDAEPVPSLLRGFSAPSALADGLDDTALTVLLRHDADPFNRWEAGQRMALNRLLDALRGGAAPMLDAPLEEAMRAVLRDPALDPGFKELVLRLPDEDYIAEQLPVYDPLRTHEVRVGLRLQLAQALRDDWAWAWEAHQVPGRYSPDAASAGRRALANLALAMLCIDGEARDELHWQRIAAQRFDGARNMTERMGALHALTESHSALAEDALQRLHAQFRGDPLVVNKWFAIQATMPERDGAVFARVKALLRHPDFSLKNPNRARSLLSTFCHANPSALHRTDAAGVVFWAERVLELDPINPQIAARLARALDRWARLAEPYRGAAREALERVAAKPGLSSDVSEIVSHALRAAH
jgi:aminopeptidase N